MVMRGPALSSTCPRCGTVAPPTDEPLAHCATCKLAFEPRAEPPGRPDRNDRRPEGEHVPAPSGLMIRREPGEVTLTWAYHRLQGVAFLVLGVICVVMLVGNLDTPGERILDLLLLGAATAFALYVGAARMFGTSVLRIDERQLLLRQEPLPLGRSVWVGRSELQEVEVRHDEGARHAPWRVVAITPRGELTLATFDAGNSIAEAAASCVAEVVREAIADIPAA